MTAALIVSFIALAIAAIAIILCWRDPLTRYDFLLSLLDRDPGDEDPRSKRPRFPAVGDDTNSPTRLGRAA